MLQQVAKAAGIVIVVVALVVTVSYLRSRTSEGSMFENASSGELVLDRQLAKQFGYSRRILTRDEVAMLVPCFELARTRHGNAGIGRKWQGSLRVDHADGSKATVGFDLELWASEATGQGGAWRVSPDIVRVLSQFRPESPPEPQR